MVSAVAGVVVGVVNGVSSALSFFGIKVFPAVILGGLDSIVGAVLGGLIVGVLENVAHYVDSRWLNWGNMYEIAPFYVADPDPDDQAVRAVRHTRTSSASDGAAIPWQHDPLRRLRDQLPARHDHLPDPQQPHRGAARDRGCSAWRRWCSGRYELGLLIQIGYLGIAALGLNILVGFTGQISHRPRRLLRLRRLRLGAWLHATLARPGLLRDPARRRC